MASSLEFLTHPDPTTRSSRRPPAWLLPAGVFAGFGALLIGLYRDRLIPPPRVEVAAVLATLFEEAPSDAGTGAPAPEVLLFQASGWIEPDPYPVRAVALVDGVVESVHVLEGQDVEKDQLLVSLIDEDARLSLEVAEGRHRLLLSAKAVHLAATEAVGRKRDAVGKEVHAAKSLESGAEDQLARFAPLAESGAVSQADVIAARLRLQRETALREAAEARWEELKAELRRMELETASKDEEIALAQVAVEQARLAWKRTRIHAPIAGRILRLSAAPGDKKMLNMDHPESSTLCMIFQPDKLQVRVDVPLADAARLQTGQRTRIHTGLLAGKVFDGEVTRITGEADVQRNTLQVKVRIADPEDRLRPEMLCRVEFLGEEAVSPGVSSASGTLALWIPEAALHGDQVWIFDPETGRLARRPVRAAGERKDGHIRIAEGLHPGERVLLAPGEWREGQRVRTQSTNR